MTNNPFSDIFGEEPKNTGPIVKNAPANFMVLNQLNPFLAGTKGFVAGGVFKNIFTQTPFRDVDVFFRSEADFNEADRDFEDIQNLELIYENDKVRAFRKNGVRVELIRHTFGEPQDLLTNFDFTITKFAYGFALPDPNSTEKVQITPRFVWHHEDFFEHLAMKRLVIDDRLVLPVNSWERSYKYARQGYNLCKDSKITLLSEIIRRGPVEESDLQAGLYAGID